MRMEDSILAKVEAQRRELEENITKLRKSLRHWQTLELDYEGLKEEFQVLPDDASREECRQVGRDFGAILVEEHDLESLLQSTKSTHRRPQQLVELLSKRVEYVARNAETIKKQLSDAEKKRNALLLAGEPEHRDEAGLPLIEITEELDDSGQVVSSKVQTPKDNAPDLLDVLKKAGVGGLDVSDGKVRQVEDPSSERATVGSTANPSIRTDDEQSVEDDRKLSHNAKPATTKSVTDTPNFPTNPNDTEDEAALRQEMHSYGLDEVGAIVAELDLEENASDVSYDEDNDLDIDSDFDEDESDQESEDETGKAKNPTISSRYRRKMEELQKRLGLPDMQNLGPSPNLSTTSQEQLDRPSPAQAARKAALARQEAATKSAIKRTGEEEELEADEKPKKKKVAFAQALDIAKEKSPEVKHSHAPRDATDKPINPVGETVIERSADVEIGSSPALAPPARAKVSRFKSARSSTPQTPMSPPSVDSAPSQSTTAPVGSPTQILPETLVERPRVHDSTSSTSAPARFPNDIDDEMHRREIAMEYHKMRNRKIHQQGGYVGQGEEDNYGDEFAPDPIEDEETGKTRKISRFKAARLKQ